MSTGHWTTLGDLPWERNVFGAASGAVRLADGRVLLAGGADERLTATAEAAVFTPTTGIWSPTAPLRTARRMHTTTVLADGRVLVTGGYGGPLSFPTRSLATAEVYDPETGRWTDTAPMERARCGHSATLLPGGRVLVAGGVDRRSGDSDGALTSAEVYDPAGGGRWTATGELADARAHHPAVALPDGGVLVAGGWAVTDRSGSGGAALAYCERYDPGTGHLGGDGRLRRAPGRPPTDAAARRFRPGHRRRAGRWDRARRAGRPVQSCHRRALPPRPGHLDPRTGHAPRPLHRALLLLSGEVLVIGGSTEPLYDGGLSSAVRYDPLSRSWSPEAGMTVGRAEFAAVALTDGRALVTAGTIRTGPSTPSGGHHRLTSTSELFTPR
ncbi:Kelch repeat-containing protein [Streptomyces exfoliatus]|uniref:Kelch repeat-containing protein n=1 Tax=Streptomyces exfoliatus TaxID=1905 RepID=UPI0004B149F0|nr:kelch repeat-containing protein [Streptomyces exfoliatus]